MIRPITPADRDRYLAFAAAFYASPAVAHPVPPSHFAACFDELMHGGTYAEALIFEREGNAVGYALLAKTYSQEAGGMVIWIEELYLRPEWRGKGVGSEFFAWLEANRPAVRYRLEIEPDNDGARRLYARMGFEVLPYEQLVKDLL